MPIKILIAQCISTIINKHLVLKDKWVVLLGMMESMGSLWLIPLVLVVLLVLMVLLVLEVQYHLSIL